MVPAADYGDAKYIGLAAVTLLITVVLRHVLTGFLKQISILLGLVAGTLIALPLGLADFSAVTEPTSSASPPRSTSAHPSSRPPRSPR